MSTKRFLRITVVILILLAVGLISPVFSGTTGIISGTVVDSEAGDPLVGVNVLIEGTTLTTVTDENGYYVITNVPPGSYDVTANLVGYTDTRTTKVSVLMDITAKVDFSMTPSVSEEEETVVTETRPMIQHDVVPTLYVIDSSQEPSVRNQPVMMYQIPGIVATQPGIVPDADGFPHIRGGRNNQIGYMLDGIPITEPISNGFGTNIVTVGMDKLEIFAGGYRPEYGNAVSGVFNQIVKTGKTNPGVKLELVGGTDAFKATMPEIGGSSANGFDYYVGSYLMSSQITGTAMEETYGSDVIGKFNYPIGNKDKLTLLTGFGTAKFFYPTEHSVSYETGGLIDINPERDNVYQRYALTALTLNHTINAKSFFTLRPYYFKNETNIDAMKLDFSEVAPNTPYWWTESESSTTGLLFDYTNQVSQQHLLKAGIIRMSSNNSYLTTVPAYGDYEYRADTDTLQTGLYVQDQMRLGPRWGVELGMRYDRMHYDKTANPDTNESQLSPRFGLSYMVDPKTNLRFSYGKMIQFVHTQAIERVYINPEWNDFYGLGSAELKPERSQQYDIGFERQMSADYSLQLTPFYRKFTDLLQVRSLDPEDPNGYPRVFDNLGDGSSKGIEMLIKKRPSKNWSAWFSYTLSSAKAESSDAQLTVSPDSYYVDWDQRHTAVLVLNYFRNNWIYSIMGEYGSGLPYNLMEEAPNSRRVPSHTVFNLNLSREVKSSWFPAGRIQLSIANIFNVRSVLDRGEDGEPIAKVPPRFISLGYSRSY